MAVEDSAPKKRVPEGLWTKCPVCENIIYNKELVTNLRTCTKCSYGLRMSAADRVAMLLESGSFRELAADLEPDDPLGFTDSVAYKDRLKASQKKSGLKEAAVVGEGRMGPQNVVLAVLDFGFMGGSMGSVVGEKVTIGAEHALKKRWPLITVSSSGGARMQEGILSLMQMAKTSAALARLREEKIPFISVLSDPTTGGVTASFATLGDVIIAEPKSLIAFAGPRVIEQTIRQTLPDGFQKSEFLMKNGMVDMIVDRRDLKAALVTLVGLFGDAGRRAPKTAGRSA